MQTYTLRGIQSMLGVSRAVVDGLVAAGFVTPSRGSRRELRFTFQDVVLLRTAYGLQQARIPPRKILRSLQKLKATLPQELPLSGLRITAVGSEVAVRDGTAQWQVESGQLVLDFEVHPGTESVRVLEAAAPRTAQAWFERAVALEAGDPAGAESAYRHAIAADAKWLDPVLNLGVMLCEAGRCAEAVELYRGASERLPDAALLHYNLALALEDLKRDDEALDRYQASIRLDPSFADAHYNAARLLEQRGEASKAIRHYAEYRRLQR